MSKEKRRAIASQGGISVHLDESGSLGSRKSWWTQEQQEKTAEIERSF